MNTKKIFSLIILLQISLLAICQQDTLIVRPESNLIDGSFIEDYTNKWKVTYITPDGKHIPNKIWTDYGQIIELEGRAYFHRVQDLYDPKMKLMDTWINMVDHKTLMPVSFSTINPNGGFSNHQFDGRRISGQTNLGTKDSTVVKSSAELSTSVYDWNLYGMLLVGLPLKEGLIAKLPIYSVPTNSMQWLTIVVVGKEDIMLPSKKQITTWKIETNDTTQQLTFWMSQSAPYAIKLTLKLPNGGILLWEVI